MVGEEEKVVGLRRSILRKRPQGASRREEFHPIVNRKRAASSAKGGKCRGKRERDMIIKRRQATTRDFLVMNTHRNLKL